MLAGKNQNLMNWLRYTYQVQVVDDDWLNLAYTLSSSILSATAMKESKIFLFKAEAF